MGYGEVESYEDFANYNEQALNLLTAKFAPVPTWVYPPLGQAISRFRPARVESPARQFYFLPIMPFFEQQRAGIEANLQERWGDRVKVFKAFNFCKPFLPDQVLEQVKQEGYDKLFDLSPAGGGLHLHQRHCH